MNKRLVYILLTVIVIFLISYLFKVGEKYTSSDAYCNSCHVHTHAQTSWMESIHYNMPPHLKQARCVDCHLPPKSEGYYKAKIKAGLRDVYAYYFKDSSEYNWHLKSQVDHAIYHTYKQSCIACHPKLFPVNLSENGEMAHWHYHQHQDELHCIHCHINVGHGKGAKSAQNLSFMFREPVIDTIYSSAVPIDAFHSFTETIPNSDVSFKMIAVEGDTSINDFFIGEIEVSWDEYMVFLSETESEGRMNTTDLDGISGATPPWGNPDQGWGLGQRPAITMTHHAATVYCQWLSARTGKSYRLPNEAEWNLAASKAIAKTGVAQEIAHVNASSTITPNEIAADGIGAKHLFGNVKEFCSDVIGEEHVIKGGSFKSKMDELSPQWKETTQHKKWLKTDPQIPKSIWWYSDCNDVGFRVVLSFQPDQNK